MKNRTFSVVIKVKNLQLCRNFYENLPGFGAPVLASSFAVIFQLADQLQLVLLQSRAPYLEHGSSATAWSFEVSDLAAFQRYLDANNEVFDPVEFHIGCDKFFRGLDPEGNVFYVKQREEL